MPKHLGRVRGIRSTLAEDRKSAKGDIQITSEERPKLFRQQT